VTPPNWPKVDIPWYCEACYQVHAGPCASTSTISHLHTHDFSSPTLIRVDLSTGHPMLQFTAHKFEIAEGVIMFYLAGRLVQLIPLAHIEHLWQQAEGEVAAGDSPS